MFQSINPYNQQILQSFIPDTKEAVDHKLALSRKAFLSWRALPIRQRTTYISTIGNNIRRDRELLARSISLEMGKPIQEALAEVDKSAMACQYFAEEGATLLGDIPIENDASKAYIHYSPIGAVLGIMPWNFPVWQVIRYAIPSLIGGNVILLKHAPNVCQTALRLEKLLEDSGLPSGVFQTLVVETDLIEGIIAHDHVQGVTLTGSEYAGSQVASLAGKYIKKSVLELGGSDPFIVLKDADLQQAAIVAAQSRMQNAGQSCIAAKRFLVNESVAEEFIQLFLTEIKNLRYGDPLLESTTLGPLARIDLAQKVEKQVMDSVKQGAQLLLPFERNHCHVTPTLLTQVKPGMPAFDEEIFGPVATVLSVKDDDDAIHLANQTRYGLGASIWSQDIERATRLATQIEAGSVYINKLMRSNVRFPFGGVKKSGYGRELGEAGIKEFMNTKTIVVS